jgi:hypothetical protein
MAPRAIPGGRKIRMPRQVGVKTLLNCKEGVQVSVGMKVSLEAY